MTWWMWTLLGLAVWASLVWVVWALVRAGAVEDKKLGR